jgi:hypothetical protein
LDDGPGGDRNRRDQFHQIHPGGCHVSHCEGRKQVANFLEESLFYKYLP